MQKAPPSFVFDDDAVQRVQHVVLCFLPGRGQDAENIALLRPQDLAQYGGWSGRHQVSVFLLCANVLRCFLYNDVFK